MLTWLTRLPVNKNMQICLIVDPCECRVRLSHKGIHRSTPGKDRPVGCGVSVRLAAWGWADCGRLHPRLEALGPREGDATEVPPAPSPACSSLRC